MSDPTNTQSAPGQLGNYNRERTSFPQSTSIYMGDTFTREQIIEYIRTVPLGYLSDREHEVTEALSDRIIRHFAELDKNWEPSYD